LNGKGLRLLIACVLSPLRSRFFINQNLGGYNPLQLATNRTWHTATFPLFPNYDKLRNTPGTLPYFFTLEVIIGYDLHSEKCLSPTLTGLRRVMMRHKPNKKKGPKPDQRKLRTITIRERHCRSSGIGYRNES
jgi:hypothetical protein